MIKEKLQEIFRDLFEEEDLIITKEMTADDIEEWDSLSHIQLIAMVQDKFKINFSISEIMSLDNVGDFIQLIESKVQ